jgi:catechol 2,3-dioxygenase-like lactoylglutathione lyase family enzyme
MKRTGLRPPLFDRYIGRQTQAVDARRLGLHERVMDQSTNRVKVLSLGWLGVRTDSSSAMSAFFRDVLGLEPIQHGGTGNRFRLHDGTEAHVYPGDDADHDFFGGGPVVGFAVASFAAARAALVAAGVEFVYAEPQRLAGRAWQHFRAPDGNIYEIIGPDDLDP